MTNDRGLASSLDDFILSVTTATSACSGPVRLPDASVGFCFVRVKLLEAWRAAEKAEGKGKTKGLKVITSR